MNIKVLILLRDLLNVLLLIILNTLTKSPILDKKYAWEDLKNVSKKDSKMKINKSYPFFLYLCHFYIF